LLGSVLTGASGPSEVGNDCPGLTRPELVLSRPFTTDRLRTCSLVPRCRIFLLSLEEREHDYVGYITTGRGQRDSPMRAHSHATGTFTPGTFGSAWERPTPISEIQTSIARALKAQYEPPQFVPEPLAKLLSQLVRGEGKG
jgi:hypothetical protein